jgi:hypothetical protein
MFIGRFWFIRSVPITWNELSRSFKSTTFWDITPCSLLKVYRRFGAIYHFHIHGRKISRERKPVWKQVACSRAIGVSKFRIVQETGADCSAFHLLHAGSFLSLFFDPEDGGDMFLRNVGCLSMQIDGVTSQKFVFFITTALRTPIIIY